MTRKFEVCIENSADQEKEWEDCLYIDYRTLNKVTTKDNFPFLVQRSNWYVARQAIFYAAQEWISPYKVAEDSIKYTAFVTPFGQYHVSFEDLMPFGLKNAPAQFERYVNEVLSDSVVAYMDFP